MTEEDHRAWTALINAHSAEADLRERIRSLEDPDLTAVRVQKAIERARR